MPLHVTISPAIHVVELDLCINRLTFQSANRFHAWTGEYILFVRRVGEFGGEVLPRKVKILVHVESPFGAIGHVVHDAVIGDKFSGAAFAVLFAQFEVRNEAVWNIHTGNYTRVTACWYNVGTKLTGGNTHGKPHRTRC